MYLGVSGMTPPDMRQIDAATVARIRDVGFSGVSCFFTDPLGTQEAEVRRVRDLLEAGGIRAAQANGKYEVLIHPDEQRRREGIAAAQALCRCGRWVGAPNVYIRPGSMNPGGQWWPHPENHAPETVERLIKSLREVAAAAEQEGVVIAVEGHVVSTLNTPEITRDVIEAVGSPALRFNVDPVNYCGTLPEAYDSTAFLNHLFDVLGPYTVCAHAKDIRVEDRHVLHLSETLLGTGLLDQETFLRRFEEYCPDKYVLIEHLPDDKVPAAKTALDAAARRAGLEWKRDGV